MLLLSADCGCGVFFPTTPSLIVRTQSRNLDCAARSFECELVSCSSSELRRVWRERSWGTERVVTSTVDLRLAGVSVKKNRKGKIVHDVD